MYEAIIQGLKPYLEKGFIDDISVPDGADIDAITVSAGDASLTARIVKNAVEIHHGDNRATILQGVAPNNAVRFILQALGRADFKIPVNIVASFRESTYPSEFKGAVVAPVGVTPGEKNGIFHAVYKDARGKFYIHEEDLRVSLSLYKGLYDRNSEGEILTLPRLFSSDIPPVLTRAYSMISEKAAEQIVARAKLKSFVECAEEGIPVRIQSAVMPPRGYLKTELGDIEAGELGSVLSSMSRAWEEALSGKAPEYATSDFDSLGIEVTAVIAASKKAHLTCTFAAHTAAGLITEAREMVIPGGEAMAILEKLDVDGITTDATLIAECFEKTKAAPVAKVPGRYTKVQSSVTAEIAEATAKSFLIKSSLSKDPVEAKTFLKDCAIPAWLQGAGAFSILSVR